MCSSKSKLHAGMIPETVSRINGRPVLQPKSNQSPPLDRRNSLKQTFPKSPPSASPNQSLTSNAAKKQVKPSSLSSPSPPISPKLKSPRQPATKRAKDAVSCNELSSSSEKVDVVAVTPVSKTKLVAKTVKKPKNCDVIDSTMKYSSSKIIEKPGCIADERRKQMAMKQEERKKKIAHYGRGNKSVKSDEKKAEVLDDQCATEKEMKRCSFITPNSDPIYVAYHDEEWGVPAHDDKQLFELLVLTGAQVGSDWTSVLKKRNTFREAFSGFDAEVVAEFDEKKMQSISSAYGIDLSLVLAAVDNSKQILKVKKQFGSFDKYLWGFVNHKPITTQHRSCQRIPIKTSKSESISKDMIRRGFRFVGPTVIYSFMQAIGLTNDHLITCPRHLQCIAMAAQPSVAVAPAL